MLKLWHNETCVYDPPPRHVRDVIFNDGNERSIIEATARHPIWQLTMPHCENWIRYSYPAIAKPD